MEGPATTYRAIEDGGTGSLIGAPFPQGRTFNSQLMA